MSQSESRFFSQLMPSDSPEQTIGWTWPVPIEVKMSSKAKTHRQRSPIDARGLNMMMLEIMLMLISPVLGRELNKGQRELLRVT